jgi:hypothetical protein
MKPKPLRTLLGLFLAVDIAFVLIHLVWLALPSPPSALFSVNTDLGYAEFFQYIKVFCIVVLLSVSFIRQKHFVYLAWAFFWSYMLFDDAFALHEKLGVWLLQARLVSSHELGEMVVYAGIGGLLILLLVAAHLLANQTQKVVSRNLAVLASLFLLFSVGVDMLNGALAHSVPTLLHYGFDLLEDSGEMFATSMIFVWVFGHFNHFGLPSPSMFGYTLWQTLLSSVRGKRIKGVS